jgi:hypothetical protein
MRGRRARTSWPLIMIGTLAGFLIHPAPAHAQAPCSLLHTCTDGSGGLDDIVDQLNDPIDEIIDVVGDATGVDTTPVKDVKKKVDDAVDRILDEAPGVGGGTEPGGSGGQGPGNDGTPGSRTPPGTQPDDLTRPRSTGRTQVPERPSAKVGVEPELGATAVDPAPARVLPEQPSRRTPLADGRVGAIPTIVRRLAFPLTLGLAVFMFLLVQSRIDKTETKLAQAPQDTHYLSFQ